MIRLLAIAGAALALLPGCGGEERQARRPDPFVKVRPTAVLPPEERNRAAPRWVRLVRLRGDGDAVRTLEVPGQSIQWRIRWRCAGGQAIRMALAPGGELGGGRCPGRGTVTAARGGRLRLTVKAAGAWSAVVEHQVDTPLHEPPLAAMRATGARPVATGRFGPIERRGSGKVLLYELADGRLALRFEKFRTTPSSDLEVWIGRGRRPRTSRAAVRAPHRSIAALKATAGSQNYVLPRGTRPADVRSVVLWCEPLYMAYASAGLR